MTPIHGNRTKPTLGLTGGIGAGKSSVAKILESLGAAVIDSDRIAHQLLQEGEVVAILREWWGDGVLSPQGGIDRRAVADIVFRRPEQLRRLEDLLYPRIDSRRAKLSADYETDPNIRAIVIDAPKLFEAGIDKKCNAVIFVEADAQVRLHRVAESRGWSEAELLRRERLQQPLDKKRASADYIVTNNCSIDLLRSEVDRVFRAILATFSSKCS